MSFRFGKLPPKKDYRTFLFQNYLKEDIPTPPDTYTALGRVCENLNNGNYRELFPMYANDRLGDCTIAAVAHSDTVFNGLISKKEIWPEDLVIRIYNHLTGGNDTGLAMMDVVQYFQKNVVAGDKLVAYVSVNPHNHEHVKQAIWLFGGLFVGFQVQEKCVEEFTQGIPWQPGRLEMAGHAVWTVGYNKAGVDNLTWGFHQYGTWPWWDLCVDEAFVLLDAEAKEPGFAPGFDFERLQKDLKEVANWF